MMAASLCLFVSLFLALNLLWGGEGCGMELKVNYHTLPYKCIQLESVEVMVMRR